MRLSKLIIMLARLAARNVVPLASRGAFSYHAIARSRHSYKDLWPAKSLRSQTPSFLSLGHSAIRRNMSVFNSSRLAGKTVLVTGASSGIGAVRFCSSNMRESELTDRQLVGYCHTFRQGIQRSLPLGGLMIALETCAYLSR